MNNIFRKFKLLIWSVSLLNCLLTFSTIVKLQKIIDNLQFIQGPGGLMICEQGQTLSDEIVAGMRIEAFDTNAHGLGIDFRNSIVEQHQKGLSAIIAILIRIVDGHIRHDYYDGLKLSIDALGLYNNKNKVCDISKIVEIQYFEIYESSEGTFQAQFVCTGSDIFVSPDLEKKKYLQAFFSAQRDVLESQFQLGQMYLDKGFYPLAAYWLKIASRRGHNQAKSLLSNMRLFSSEEMLNGVCICDDCCANNSLLPIQECVTQTEEQVEVRAIESTKRKFQYDYCICNLGLCKNKRFPMSSAWYLHGIRIHSFCFNCQIQFDTKDEAAEHRKKTHFRNRKRVAQKRKTFKQIEAEPDSEFE